MTELLNANIRADLAFFRRSRLLLAFALVFLLLIGLNVVPSLFINSGVQKFNALQEILSSLHAFIEIFSGALALFIVSSHLRSRSLKMVFTKPCTPAVWLLSALLSAVAVTFALSLLVFGSSVVLSLVWHLPVRVGLVFVALDNFIASVGIIVYMILLSMLFHPAIAVIVALIFNASTFYEAEFGLLALIRSGNTSSFLRIVERLLHYLYLVVPIMHAFSDKTRSVYSSLRVAHGEWKYVLYSFGYVLTLSAFSYFAALFLLQRKKHI